MSAGRVKCDPCPIKDSDQPCIEHIHPAGWCKRLKESEAWADPIRLHSRVHGGEQPLPSIVTQAKNLAVATARDAQAGFARLDEGAAEARLAICRRCPSYRPSDERCAICGCFLNAKATRPHEHCPLGKWPGDPQSQDVS